MRTARCAASGCDREVGERGCRGWCSKHYQRFLAHGSPETVAHRGMWMAGRTGATSNRWVGNQVKYRGAHARITRERGRPSHCEFCGTNDSPGPRGFQWALSHDAQLVLTDESGRVFSANPSDYIRLCAPCHSGYDQAGVPRKFRQSSRYA